MIFAYSASAARRIEQFPLSEPDDGHDEEHQRTLTAEDIEGFGWKLAHAPADPRARMLDVDDLRSYLAAAPKAIPALLRYGIKRFDRHTLLDERRYVTRRMAGIYRADATDGNRWAARGGTAVHEPPCSGVGVLGVVGAAPGARRGRDD